MSFSGNPNQPIQNSKLTRQHILKIQKINQSLENTKNQTFGSKSIEFTIEHETVDHTVCSVSGLSGVSIESIQSNLPSGTTVIAGDHFRILVKKPVSRQWSKRQLILLFSLLVFILFITRILYKRLNIFKTL